MNEKGSYVPILVLTVATLAVYVWYILDYIRHRGTDSPLSPLTNPLATMWRAAKAVWHEQTLLFLLFVLWVTGAMGGWIRVFMLAAPAQRDDRRIGLLFYDPWSTLQVLQDKAAVTDAFIRSLPKLTEPFTAGYEGALLPALLICGAIAVSLFLGSGPSERSGKAKLGTMLVVGFVSAAVWGAIPWVARTVQIADLRHETLTFRPSPQLLMVLALVLQAPLSALLGSCSFAALHEVAATGDWQWRRMLGTAANAFAPLLWVRALFFLPLVAAVPILSTVLPPEKLAQSFNIVLVGGILTRVSSALSVVFLFVAWGIVADNDGAWRALRRNFRLIRRNALGVFVFVLRAAAVAMPLALLVVISETVFSQTLAGKFIVGCLGGFVSMLLLLATASAYIYLRETQKAAAAAAAKEQAAS
jgi:hypothetical protein